MPPVLHIGGNPAATIQPIQHPNELDRAARD
jgi:hypothetical protein